MRILTKTKLIGTLFSLIAAPVAAENLACNFTTECYETVACDVADFDIRVVATAQGSYAFESLGPTGPATFVEQTSEHMSFFGLIETTEGAIGLQMLSRANTGKARYTVQYFEGPMTISYHGTCEVTHD